MMMEEEEGEVALQEPTVADDVGLDETGPTGLEAPSVKVMVSSLNETLSNVQYKKNFEGGHLGGEGGRGGGSLAPELAAPGRRG